MTVTLFPTAAPAVPVRAGVVCEIDGQAARFTAAHRPQGVPVAEVTATITATLPLSREDLVAALFYWSQDGDLMDELADDDAVRALVAESVLNAGLSGLGEMAAEVANAETDPTGREWVLLCRAAIARVFPAAVPAPRRPRTLRSLRAVHRTR